MINQTVIVGRLTADPNLRYTPNGIATCGITLAVNRPFTNQQGNKEADFINVVIWRKQAENTANYLKKGSLAGVTGRIQTRNYENSEGKKVFVTEVIADQVAFLDSNGKGSDSQQTKPSEPNMQDNDSFSGGEVIDISDDDLPF